MTIEQKVERCRKRGRHFWRHRGRDLLGHRYSVCDTCGLALSEKNQENEKS